MQDQQETAVPGKRRRLDQDAPVPTVTATAAGHYISRKGLRHFVALVNCPGCGTSRSHRDSGYRMCPCGTAYEVAA